MQFIRMPIEVESPEEAGYDTIDYNLAESSVTDIHVKEILPGISLDNILLNYGAHRGAPGLRAAIVAGEAGLAANHVLVTPGAAAALFFIHTTLLQPADHLVVLRPNYGTNIETPVALGCNISYVDLLPENNYRFTAGEFISQIQPHTRLLSITTPHNPTGVEFDDSLIMELAAEAEKRNIYLLVDETYRYLQFQSSLKPYYASRSASIISVASLSKAFGAPGIRLGWLISQDEALMEKLLAAKEQVLITNSVVDEYIGEAILQQKEKLLHRFLQQAGENFIVVKAWMKAHEDLLDWTPPTAGVVAFPRFREHIQVNWNQYYHRLRTQYKTMVGPGHWFLQSQNHFRLGFGWTDKATLQQGLENIISCLRDFGVGY